MGVPAGSRTHLISERDLNDLGDFQAEIYGERFRVVDNRSNETVVVAQQIVVQALCVGIGFDVLNS